jgi:hypothetical protein
MKNQVIKVLTPEHGEKVIEYWKSKGVDTRGKKGSSCESDGNKYIYYGVINGVFDNCSAQQLGVFDNFGKVEIIELPTNKFDMTYPIYDMTTNEGRLAYAKKHYPIGTEFLNTRGEYRKVTGIPKTIYEGTTIDVKSMDVTGEDGFYPNLYSEEHGWCEIIKQEEKVMETQKLSRQGLKEIHSVACSSWKTTLEQFGRRNPLEDYIELSQEEINIMFKACTENQLPIVSKYLKQDDGSVDVTKFKFDGDGILDDKSFYIIRDREWGKYRKKSFLLSPRYNWEIKEDELGYLCLIPTKKK